jgi:hypothetical protein
MIFKNSVKIICNIRDTSFLLFSWCLILLILIWLNRHHTKYTFFHSFKKTISIFPHHENCVLVSFIMVVQYFVLVVYPNLLNHFLSLDFNVLSKYLLFWITLAYASLHVCLCSYLDTFLWVIQPCGLESGVTMEGTVGHRVNTLAQESWMGASSFFYLLFCKNGDINPHLINSLWGLKFSSIWHVSWFLITLGNYLYDHLASANKFPQEK